MARPLRVEFEHACYHVTSRGNARQAIFLNNADREKFLRLLKQAKDRFSFRLYAYILMTNHYHLVIETSSPNLSRILQQVNSAYTNYFKIKHKLDGHLLQGRYKALLVEKDSYLLELIRYVHMNPVKAGMVDRPDKYPWSSLGAYQGNMKTYLIDQEEILGFFGKRKAEARRKLLEFLSDKQEEPEWIKNPYRGFILGKTDFIKGILRRIEEDRLAEDVVAKKSLSGKTDVEQILDLASKESGIEKEIIMEGKRKRIPE